MFKPKTEIPYSSNITISIVDDEDSVVFSTILLPPPSLPRPDEAYSQFLYGSNFWHCIIPWSYIKPGISFAFNLNGLSGCYQKADVGGAGELIINTIDIGMLTKNREVFSFQYDSAYHTQYFETIPVSKLIVNEYEPVHWKEIVLPDGTLYRTHSMSEGGVYSGDLRQRIGKELISLGINNANYGIFSSPGVGESLLSNPYYVAQCTAHNSVGNYTNGIVVHGLSGGGGMVTLHGTLSNEFSHELGHCYGMGHYPGGFKGSIHRSAGNINSAWGWDSGKNKFIPNFDVKESGSPACYEDECQAPFFGHKFGSDSMAGGDSFNTSLNVYTPYTPYTLKSIQEFFERKVVFNKHSSTGYSKWNEHSLKMEEWSDSFTAPPECLSSLKMMNNLIENNNLINIVQYDGNYSKFIFIPPARPDNAGKGLRIIHDATLVSYLFINYIGITLTDQVLYFESDGSRWVSVKEFAFNVARKPQHQGIRVTTLVGYYDPEAKIDSYVYPALHCAYGNTFENNRDAEVFKRGHYAEITNSKGELLRFLLRSERLDKNFMNRFHLNVATSFAPTHITIFANGTAVASRELQPPIGGTRHTENGRAM
ncbi:M66 family metalloprotease [Mesorhizobium sp. NBSH29]|uniref:M66 family metalloprotease n=1 Tax=Mesorhizobium sp. NBSH29 TaxID=2654249 RepID=UPI0018968A90|nr:M66 family metalloprotease [Mesorhizobium sp. NBSH29]